MSNQLTARFSHPVDALAREFHATIGKRADDEYTAKQLDRLQLAWDGKSITGPAHIVMSFIGALADDGDDTLTSVESN